MKSSLLIVLLALAASPALFAQSSTTSPNAIANGNGYLNKKSDQDWASLVALNKSALASSSSVSISSGVSRTPAQMAADQAQQARHVAQTAKTFYTNYPNHPKAAEAQKIEVMQSLRGVMNNDRTQEQVAQRIASTYRSNSINSASDRFDVAVLSECVSDRAQLGGKASGYNSIELERIAGKLRIEFGDIPECFNFYASVARGADMVTAKRIAANLMLWPAGREAQAEAQSILVRDALLNKNLGWKLTTVDGQVVDLAQQAGKPTLIYAWTPGITGTGLSTLTSFKRKLPANLQVIYFVLGATVAQVQVAKNAAPIPGIFCWERLGAFGPTAKQFQIRRSPYVFLLNQSGVLAGFGPANELGNLITATIR